MESHRLHAVLFEDPNPPAIPGLCDVCQAPVEPEWARYAYGCGGGQVYLCVAHLIDAVEGQVIPQGSTILRLQARWVA
jgi:hypothetical protein